MTLEQKKALIQRFLERCNRYADDRIMAYRGKLADATGVQALELADKLTHWAAYRAFNDYTIAELETAELDDWLDGPDA